ncbi:MAG: RluA family pseudouridine synthase [Pseudomonadota bacterium]
MKTLTIDSQEGERLDTALVRVHGGSRAKMQRLIESGGVLINGHPALKASYRLRLGDVVALEPHLTPPPEADQKNPRPEAMALDILFEDADVIVLNKPQGMVVHPGAGHQRSTLVHALLYHASSLSTVGGGDRPGIVHRLDKDTSGLMMVAKSDDAHLELARQFQGGEVSKLYLAVVLGEPAKEQGRIEAPIGRHPTERQRMAVRQGGRAALTQWRVLERFGGCCALLEFRLHTGRTHQIRVHSAYMGHPVAGDATYGGRRFGSLRGSLELRQALALSPRQLLHSWRLSFVHPRGGPRLDFEAAPPPDFSAVLDLLRQEVAKKHA